MHTSQYMEEGEVWCKESNEGKLWSADPVVQVLYVIRTQDLDLILGQQLYFHWEMLEVTICSKLLTFSSLNTESWNPWQPIKLRATKIEARATVKSVRPGEQKVCTFSERPHLCSPLCPDEEQGATEDLTTS